MIATETFRPAPVPEIVASMGAAYAVLLASAPAVDEALDVCDLPVPHALQRAVPARIRSYVAGRHCVTRSLLALSSRARFPLSLTPLEIGAFGAPVWPMGVTGSITHSARLAIAVVALRDAVQGIGIDCERIMSAEVADEVGPRILPEDDGSGRFADAVRFYSRPEFLSIVFSAKESLYKCLNPLNGTFFGFDAVVLERVDTVNGRMVFRVVHDLGPAAPSGATLLVRFVIDEAHVVTAVSLPWGGEGSPRR